MSFTEDLDKLLEKIKESHFQTVHRLSELYKKAEALINELKDKGEGNMSVALENIKTILAEGTDIRDGQVNTMREYFKTYFTSVFNNIADENQNTDTSSNENNKEKDTTEDIPIFNMSDEDANKIMEITQNNMVTMYGLFKRTTELFSQHMENKEQTKNKNQNKKSEKDEEKKNAEKKEKKDQSKKKTNKKNTGKKKSKDLDEIDPEIE